MNKITNLQKKLYETYLNKYGLNLKGIASESKEIKDLRYSIILNEILIYKKKFSKISILDCGSGLGDLLNYIQKKKLNNFFDYEGNEINQSLIAYCKKKFKNKKFFYSDLLDENIKKRYDFIIFSGTFYHKPKEITYKEYLNYIKRIFEKSWKNVNVGIIFNFLNYNSDYKKKGLFYPKANDIYKIIEALSRFNKRISNYPLFENTNVVVKKRFIKKIYNKKDYYRYLF